jgi:hypothetical protein
MTHDEVERAVVDALMEFLRPPDDPPDPEGEPIDDTLRDATLSGLGVSQDQMDGLLDAIEEALRDDGLPDFELEEGDVPANPEMSVRQLVACVDEAVNPPDVP